MEVLTLLLMFFTVSGFSFDPRLTLTQIAGLNRDDLSDLRSEQLRDVSISADVRENQEESVVAESTEIQKTEEEQRHGRITETNPVRKPVKKEKTGEERRGEDGQTSQTNPEKQMIEEKPEHEIIETGNTDEILDRNQGYVKGSEVIMTPETFPTNISIKDEYSEHETWEYVDTEVVVEMRENGLNLVPNLATEKNDESGIEKTAKTIKNNNTGVQEEAMYDKKDVRFKESDRLERLNKEILKEERVSELVAGIRLHETRGDTHEDEKIITEKQDVAEEKGGNGERKAREERGEDIKSANLEGLVERENKDRTNNLTPPLSTSSAQVGKELEIPATIQIVTQSQYPPSSPPPPLHHHHNVPHPLPLPPTQVPADFSHLPVLDTKVTFLLSPPSANIPTPISHISDLTVTPGHHLKLKEVLDSVLEDVIVKNIFLKPAWKQRETHTAENTREINTAAQPKDGEFIATVQAATPKPDEAKFIFRDIFPKQPNPTPQSNENMSTPRLVKLKLNTTVPTSKPTMMQLMENDTKVTVKQKKTSPHRLKLTRPSAKPQLTAAARTPSPRPTKSNKSSKNKTIRRSKEKKRKVNKTQKPSEKKKKDITPPSRFPYFKDNYCPPECACYGRVVQCSDKGVDKVPYGIPYNTRYILLMNNHINNIQLDLLSEYVSMEFLVLSNNRLTDGAIEGAFEGVPALKRLYLDRNLLESVPADLPISLEELRLDDNHLRVMSEAAWARCPSLLVLSLSNNSLGRGSESLPNAVLSPLCNLRTLNLDHNQLTSVPLGLPLSIKELYLKGNLIEQFCRGAFNGISGLVVLDLSANRLTNKGFLRDSLLNATHLESLNLEGNRLKQVPRHLPPSLKTLNLEGNFISSIKKGAFNSLTNLEHLGLARNKIFKVAPGAFRTLPVLHQLDLCHNTLHQVPRQLPQSLHSVTLTHNKIQSVPRDAFCWGNKSLSLSRLTRVQLEHNLIDMRKLDGKAFGCLRGFQVVHFY